MITETEKSILRKAQIVEYKRSGVPKDFSWDFDPSDLSGRVESIPMIPSPAFLSRVTINSEDLRDGLQGQKTRPSITQSMFHIGRLVDVGITDVTVGIYSGEYAPSKNTLELLARIREEYPQIHPLVISLMTLRSIEWSRDCLDKHPDLEVHTFIAGSPSRRMAQGWSEDDVLRKIDESLTQARRAGLDNIMGTPENSTQTDPAFFARMVEVMYQSAGDGLKRICVADTAGWAGEAGTARIFKFLRDTLDRIGAGHVRMDHHGHNDRGMSVPNALVAIAQGADRIHAVTRGSGERTGNTPTEILLLNLKKYLNGVGLTEPWNLRNLQNMIGSYKKIVKLDHGSYGCLGKNSHFTDSGVHASAYWGMYELIKTAISLGEEGIAQEIRERMETMYSVIGAREVGKNYVFGVGPGSGAASVRMRALAMGIDPYTLTDSTIDSILEKAKSGEKTLTNTQIREIISSALAELPATKPVVQQSCKENPPEGRFI